MYFAALFLLVTKYGRRGAVHCRLMSNGPRVSCVSFLGSALYQFITPKPLILADRCAGRKSVCVVRVGSVIDTQLCGARRKGLQNRTPFFRKV